MALTVRHCFYICSILLILLFEQGLTEDLEIPEEEIPTVQGAYEDGDGVLVLSNENFDDVVNNKDIILVEFYAPWCGHCKTLAPEYAKAAKRLKESKPSIPLAKVDATLQEPLAKRFEVSGFPTLLIFRRGQKFAYDGPRSSEGIVEYMLKEGDPNWKPPPVHVLTLTADNFTATVSKRKLILVEFYAPWCGHCKRLAPEYERAARILSLRSPEPIPLAKVDAMEEKELGQLFNVTGYPTLFIFRSGKSFKYNGPREEEGIVKYMQDQAKPPSKEMKNIRQLDNNLHKTEPTVIGLFTGSDDPMFDLFINAGNELREELPFLHSFDEAVAKHLSSELGSVVIQQPAVFKSTFEPKHQKITKASSSNEIIEFLKEHRLPLVGWRTPSNLYLFNEHPLVVVYYDVDFGFENRAQTQLVRNEVLKVASAYKGKVKFAISKEEEFADELKDLNLDDSGEDVNVGYFAGKTARYRMPPTDDFNEKRLRKFVEGVQKGEIARQIRSQPVPKQDGSPVTTIVGSNFQKLVTESSKHVLLEFYAPWCGHCKKLEPIYKKIAKTLTSEHDDIVVAKIDGTANDFPETFEVGGYPTVFFINARDRESTQYKGTSRTHDDLVKFVREQLPTKDEL